MSKDFMGDLLKAADEMGMNDFQKETQREEESRKERRQRIKQATIDYLSVRGADSAVGIAWFLDVQKVATVASCEMAEILSKMPKIKMGEMGFYMLVKEVASLTKDPILSELKTEDVKNDDKPLVAPFAYDSSTGKRIELLENISKNVGTESSIPTSNVDGVELLGSVESIGKPNLGVWVSKKEEEKE